MARLLVILLIMVLLAGCKGGSGSIGGLSFGSDYGSGSPSTISTTPYASGSDTSSGDNPTYPTPEPSTIALFAVALFGIAVVGLRKKK